MPRIWWRRSLRERSTITERKLGSPPNPFYPPIDEISLMAPFPIVGVYLGVMAYGEWLFGLVSLWQTDQNEFFNCMYLGIGRMVFALGFIGLIVGFMWALDPPNNWILWEVVKYSFYLAVVSIVSFFSYRYHRRWKIRHRWREFIRRIHTAAAERIHPSR